MGPPNRGRNGSKDGELFTLCQHSSSGGGPVLEMELGIMEVVQGGDLQGIRHFLKEGGNVNFSNATTGRTLLHIASRQGYEEIVTLLLGHGANAGARTLRRLTPLHLAANQGHHEVARVLLEAWSPVDDQDQAGATPLHLATQQGFLELARLLLQCGARIDKADVNGWTALHFAVWKGHLNVVRLLLQHGADTESRISVDGVAPLHLACIWGHPQVARLLLGFGADVSAETACGDRPEDLIGSAQGVVLKSEDAQELAEIIIGHPSEHNEGLASSPLVNVVERLQAKVKRLEEQLLHRWHERQDSKAFIQDGSNHIFAAAIRPECPICRFLPKEAVLEPCLHLASCYSCAETLTRCPFCECHVNSFRLVENPGGTALALSREEELAGLRLQLGNCSKRVVALLAANSELNLELGKVKELLSQRDADRPSIESIPESKPRFRVDKTQDRGTGHTPWPVSSSKTTGGNPSSSVSSRNPSPVSLRRLSSHDQFTRVETALDKRGS